MPVVISSNRARDRCDGPRQNVSDQPVSSSHPT
jgi:hypothetical protein